MGMGYVAGEHVNRDVPAVLRNGLSPLARGSLPDNGSTWLNDRFIPAGAGNTSFPASVSDEMPVYPRWRGEHVSYCDAATHYVGLSPLARGTRQALSAR